MAAVAEYQNFDVHIEKTERGTFEVTSRSTTGTASREVEPPFSALELQNLILRAGLLRSTTRSGSSDARTAARELGTRLFDGFLGGNVGEALRASVALAAESDTGVRIRLHLDQVPELAHYPWEFWNRASDDRFLVLSRQTPVVRYIDTDEPMAPVEIAPPLRVLLLVSDPTDSRFVALDVEKEKALIAEALAPLTTAGLVELVPLPTASLNALRDELNLRGGHIVHFVGHGVFDAESGEGLLEMETEDGMSRMVPGRDLGTMLRDHDVRLVVLNSCEGARNDTSDPFAGAASSLILKGIPAVIAMQFEITDDAAKDLAAYFYAGIVRGEPIDTALTEARLRLFGGGNPTEWATPVLYLQSDDGRLFRMSEQVGHTPELMAAADQAVEREDWVEAARLLSRAEVLNPDDAPIAERAHQTRRRVAAAATLNEIRRMADAGDVDQAAALLRAVRLDVPEADEDGALAGLIEQRRQEASSESSESPIPSPLPPNRRWWWVLGAVFGLAAVILGAVVFWPSGDPRVPLVVGLSEFDAVRILTDTEITPVVLSEESDDVDEGVVITQDPTSGEHAKSVTLVVSQGRPTVVPAVLGLSEADARAALAAAGVEASTTTRPAEAAAGTVIEVVPPEGTNTSGAVLVISDGAPLPEIPNVVGLTQVEAESALSARGIGSRIEERESGADEEGLVVGQEPPAGARTDTALLLIGAGPGLPVVPNVVGLSEAEARLQLDPEGVAVSTVNRSDPNLPVGQVLSQNPAAGARSDRVELELSDGPGLDDYLGDWTNIDEGTQGTTRLSITSAGGNAVTVAGFGACSPSDCEWGTAVGEYGDRKVTAAFDFGWKTTTVMVERIGGIVLVHHFDDYAEGDGREDRESVYVMSSEPVMALTEFELAGIGDSELYDTIVSAPGASVLVPLVPIQELELIAP